MANCTFSSADGSFALQVCPNVFDFSLQFEQLIISILPNSLIFVAAVFTLFVDRSYSKYEKFHHEPDLDEVRLFIFGNFTNAHKYRSNLAHAGGRSSNWYCSEPIPTAYPSLTLVHPDQLRLFMCNSNDHIDPMDGQASSAAYSCYTFRDHVSSCHSCSWVSVFPPPTYLICTINYRRRFLVLFRLV